MSQSIYINVTEGKYKTGLVLIEWTGEQALCCTCSLRIMDGGIEKKYPAFTPSMATDGLPSKAWSRAFSTPSDISEELQFTS